MVFQQILNGLTNGSIYALLAIGVTMIYKSLGMLNFAHGDTIMISAFICLTLITRSLDAAWSGSFTGSWSSVHLQTF